MCKEVLDFPVNNSICGACGCFEESSSKIKAKAGQLVLISLDLSSRCVNKLDNKERMLYREEA